MSRWTVPILVGPPGNDFICWIDSFSLQLEVDFHQFLLEILPLALYFDFFGSIVEGEVEAA